MAIRRLPCDGFRLVVRILFGNAVEQISVLLAILLADGVAVTYNKIGDMSVPDIFVRSAVATDYVGSVRQYL